MFTQITFGSSATVSIYLISLSNHRPSILFRGYAVEPNVVYLTHPPSSCLYFTSVHSKMRWKLGIIYSGTIVRSQERYCTERSDVWLRIDRLFIQIRRRGPERVGKKQQTARSNSLWTLSRPPCSRLALSPSFHLHIVLMDFRGKHTSNYFELE